MKKLLAILLAAMMIFALAACGNNETPVGSNGNNPGTSQTDNQSGENNDDGQDYENAGFNKAQRKVIAEQIGVTTEGEKVVFMYEVEDDDEVVYYDVYDQFNGTTCRYTDYRFCKNKDAYDGEANDMDGDYDDLTANEKDLYLFGSEEAKFSWAGTWQSVVDDYNNGLRAADYVIVE